jgi:hypothetical protein
VGFGIGITTLPQIVTEVAAVISEALEDSDLEVAVNAGMLFNPTTTAIDIYPDDPFIDEDTAAQGAAGGYRWIVRARTGLNDLDSGQEILLSLMDRSNSWAIDVALEDDPTLSGLAQDVFVSNASGFRPFRDLGGEGTMAGVVWNVLVIPALS